MVWNLTEAERKKFRDQFLYAEQELAAAKGREGVLQEQLLKEVDDSRERLKKQIQLCSELEVHFVINYTEISQLICWILYLLVFLKWSSLVLCEFATQLLFISHFQYYFGILQAIVILVMWK